ncbi:patatin-like phospholipase family protein [Uliginosibacterium sp. 31-16]|uniref:patatin-like phospholipase family protein n=1 Tax=Uliginosibacterium sp. 31-16 TaxID=3068315 RepID=UPI00273DCEF8|nr:patatin-like phospholipase family protein [Uliginosibacterium sp. 31-16]MDP5240506.1 patatin-like phospholipase family protein [Uliginosibacterium sp. 31-16]
MFAHRDSASPSLNLALQGGGAHGAFTWGVLDALLEDGRFRFDGISGTSAGAMNAVALANGWVQGGAEGARECLAKFWEGVALMSSPDLLPPVLDSSLMTPGTAWMMQLTRWFSPYQLNPMDLNPLRDLVVELFDFERLQRESPFELFVAATHANSGHLKLFRNADLSADALLASACLPSVHHAIIINGEPYWDGAYAANPAVFPLFRFCDSRDVLIVMLAPLLHERTPRGAEEIQQRTLELGFNNSFLREMRLLAAMRDMAEESGWLSGSLEQRLRSERFHLIEGEAALGSLAATSKIVANQAFLHRLRDAGRVNAKRWLVVHGPAVGHRPSVDIHKLFLPQ